MGSGGGGSSFPPFQYPSLSTSGQQNVNLAGAFGPSASGYQSFLQALMPWIATNFNGGSGTPATSPFTLTQQVAPYQNPAAQGQQVGWPGVPLGGTVAVNPSPIQQAPPPPPPAAPAAPSLPTGQYLSAGPIVWQPGSMATRSGGQMTPTGTPGVYTSALYPGHQFKWDAGQNVFWGMG